MTEMEICAEVLRRLERIGAIEQVGWKPGRGAVYRLKDLEKLNNAEELIRAEGAHARLPSREERKDRQR